MDFVEAIFRTAAFRVSPADQPFWYTSGLFGPYYINSHFVYGSEQEAKAFLAAIEEAAEGERRDFTAKLLPLVTAQLEHSAIYRDIIDHMADYVQEQLPELDLISGGERRDFFFSLPLAWKLGLPHLSIFKDGSCYYNERLAERAQTEGELGLAGRSCLHVADLITEASSYFRNWLPCLERLGLRAVASLALVDRCQGGVEKLESAGIQTHCLLQIRPELFSQARVKGLIDQAQEAQLQRYYEDPRAYVRQFLAEQPQFLDREARRDAKTRERVERLRSLEL